MDGKVVLVVDDDQETYVLIDMVLRELLHVSTIPAQSGKEAVEQVHSAKPALVLMDMRLPELDGMEATKLLKSNPATKTIPIIGISADVPDWIAMIAGCDDFIAKPFDLDIFVDTVQTHLHRPSSQAA